MTKKEFFNLISDKIDNYAFPAYDEKAGQCSYLAPDGRECFVGVLIPKDKVYKNSPLSLYELIKCFPEVSELFPIGCNVHIMSHVQGIHDDYYRLTPEEFTSKKEEILNKLKLALQLEDDK